MTHRLELFGTEQDLPARRHFTAGPISFWYENGALRHIALDGVEAIRGIAFLVRDRDWGTVIPEISKDHIEQTERSLRLGYTAKFKNDAVVLEVRLSIIVNANGLTMTAKAMASAAFETNRAGFTVLHPIDGVAGCPVQVHHSDGTNQKAQFPALIAPWQPFMDITALSHQAGGKLVTCQFRGDTFEMEDQRQWGDASFKTYNRPLAKPWPYQLTPNAALEQTVELTWQNARKPAALRRNPRTQDVLFPQMALVITADDATRLANQPDDITLVRPQRLLCHLDATLGATKAQFQSFATAQKACPNILYDLELICLCAENPLPELQALAAQMHAGGFAPSSVLVCPSVDRQSTPPGSDWPPCPPLAQLHAAAAKAFPDMIRGGGMVSFFPELNRKRPPVEALDFISHGLCPIVHAADDLSVMETLEAVPHITTSARAIIGKRPYRIGPATIAMRQNPYGQRTLPNPGQTRICMADDDPRHRAKFGAVYTIGLATALAPAAIEVWTPAALYGPRGVISADGSWPLAHALKHLARAAGHAVHSAKIANGLAQLHVGSISLIANLTPDETRKVGPYSWCLRNPRQ